VITKPKQHDINRAGKRLCRTALETLGWVVNDTTEDYATDSYVQVFQAKGPTGTWFLVQLKSSARSRYSKDQKSVAQPLKLDRARHYANELRQPIVLIHADTASQRVFWHAPQLDDLLATNANKKSITVKIPTKQVLPETADDLLKTVNTIHLTLANRELTVATTSSFSDSLKHVASEAALQRSLQDKNDLLKLRKISQYYQRREYADARPRVEVVSRDPDAATYSRVWALAQLGYIDSASTFRSERPQKEIEEKFFASVLEMRKITRRGPRYLKFFYLILKTAAELHMSAHQHYSCVLALQARLNPLLINRLRAQKEGLARKAVFKYRQCLKLMRSALKLTDRFMLTRAFVKIAHSIGFYMLSLRIEENAQIAETFLSSALAICKLSEEIDAQSGDQEGRANAILGAMMLTQSADSDAFRWAMDAAGKLPKGTLRTDVFAKLTRAKDRWSGQRPASDYQGDVERQATQNIASALGIDIVGIQDADSIAAKVAARNAGIES
jgi:hypothetical protein